MELSRSYLPNLIPPRLFRLAAVLMGTMMLQGCSMPTISWGDDEETQAAPVAAVSSGISREDIIANAGEVASGEIVKIGDRIMMMGNLYMSASGLQCRQVTILGAGAKETRLACKQGPDWCLTKSVITK